MECVQLLAALPPVIKSKIFENGIKTFNEDISDTEKYQLAQTAACLTSSIPEDTIQTQIVYM